MPTSTANCSTWTTRHSALRSELRTGDTAALREGSAHVADGKASTTVMGLARHALLPA